jgi:hypothetical protein
MPFLKGSVMYDNETGLLDKIMEKVLRTERKATVAWAFPDSSSNSVIFFHFFFWCPES